MARAYTPGPLSSSGVVINRAKFSIVQTFEKEDIKEIKHPRFNFISHALQLEADRHGHPYLIFGM